MNKILLFFIVLFMMPIVKGQNHLFSPNSFLIEHSIIPIYKCSSGEQKIRIINTQHADDHYYQTQIIKKKGIDFLL